MFDVATQAKLFNEYITPGVSEEIKARSKLFERMKKSDKIELGGLYAKIKMMVAASQSSRASSSSSYPTAGQSTPNYGLVYLKRAQMFQLQFDGMALELAEKKGTPIDPMVFEQRGIMMTLADDMSRQLFLDGSGHLCQANGAGAPSATLLVDSPFYGNATKFLKASRLIDSYLAAVQEINSATVQTVDSDTQVTLAAATNWTDDSWIFNEDTFTTTEAAGKGESMGLDGIVRNTDPPYPNAASGLQGLTVAAEPEWKAHVFDNGGVKRPLVEDLLIAACDAANEFGSVNVLLTTMKLRRVWHALLASYKAIPTKQLWGGIWDAEPFYYDGKTIPMVADRFCPDGRIYGLTEDDLTLFVTGKGTEITWEKGVAGEYLQKVVGKNEYVSEGHIFLNLGCHVRKSHFVIKDLDEPAA